MYTPSTIGLELQNTIRKLTELKIVIEITGVYFDQRGKFYRDYCYDRLDDCGLGANRKGITLLVPKNKKPLLRDGTVCELRCTTRYKISDENSIEMLFKVEEVINKEITIDTKKQEEINKKGEILSQFHSFEQPNLSLLLKTLIKKKQLPSIALIQPNINDTLNDVKGAIGEHGDKYFLKDFRVNINSEQEIIKNLQEIDAGGHFHLIVLFRGGGAPEDLDVFESTKIGEAIVRLRTPFVTAIGHAGDEPFIVRISNRSFITPNDFGNYLKEIYINSGREDDLTDREDQLKSSLNTLVGKQKEIESKEKDLDAKTNQLQNQKFYVENKTEKLNLEIEQNNKEKQQNSEILKQIESDKIKNRRIMSAAVAGSILFGIIFGIAAYFAMAYVSGSPKTPKTTSVNNNSDVKMSSNLSDSKN